MGRWLADQPVRRKLAVAAAAFGVVIGLLLATGWFAMNTLSAVRAYVAGEGFWSKGQKDAVAHLIKYAHSKDERDYAEYRRLLQVPLADRRARLELEKPEADLAVADRAFIEGRNHPDDAHAMSLFFRRFRRVRYMERSVDMWAQADALVEELDECATEIFRSIASGKLDDRQRSRLLDRVDSVAARLTVVEDEFSFSLAEGARWLSTLLITVMASAAALGSLFALYVAYSVSNGILTGVANLRRGTALVGAGDFGARIPVEARDELGLLASDFNEMTDSLVRSVEERREAERKLAAHARELEEAHRSLLASEKVKSEFFANVSHELRTPLSLILAPLESLLDGTYGDVGVRARPPLETMHNNAVRLLQLLQGLLDFQKLDARKVDIRREPIDLAALTRSIVADFEGLMRKRALRHRVEVVDERSARVLMDRYAFERIAFNLLSNAVKFTPEGGEIVVRLRCGDDHASLAITDTGIGIRDEDQPRLFDRFQQVEGASTRRFEGVGLGLALVKEFAELLGGTVTLASRPGEGSTFTVECAAPDASGEELVAVSRPPQRLARDRAEGGSEPLAPLGGLSSSCAPAGRVLVVEDNAELARYVADCLAQVCEVRVSSDGEEALEIVRTWMPTIVLADVMMPMRDGLSLCRDLKNDTKTRSIPVVLLTALTYREALLRGWEAGADDYLFKPFHPTELVTRIRALLATQLRLREETEARAAAEAALTTTTRQLAEAQQIAHVGSWELDVQSQRVSWSAELYRIFGLEPSSMDMTSDDRLAPLHPHDRELVKDVVARSLETKEPFAVEYRVVREGGGIGWVHGRGRVHVDDRGAPVRMTGTAHDITEQKQAEESRVRLAEAEVARTVAERAHERSALLAGASAILATSLDSRQTLSSLASFLAPRFASLCVMTVHDTDLGAASASPTAASSGEPQVLVDRWLSDSWGTALVERVIRTGEREAHHTPVEEPRSGARQDELGARDALRRVGIDSVLVVPIAARTKVFGALTLGVAPGRTYVAADLELAEELAQRVGLAVDNARLYESEQRARDRADRASRAKDEFLAIVSHELRTPINAVLGWTQLLRAGRLAPEKRETALETIDRNAKTQARLIEDLLDVARVVSGKLHLHLELVDLARIVEHATDTLRPGSTSKGVQISTSLDTELGPLHGDAQRLQQVVFNLLDNALKFTPRGGRVEVTLQRVGSQAKLEVTDTGQGISEDFVPHVFERFCQADASSTRLHGGLGIGLAISKQIIEAHGGNIEARNRGDRPGAVFTVWLEVAHAESGTEETQESGRADGPSMVVEEAVARRRSSELQALKVLVVDDEEDARDLLLELLQGWGAKVSVAGSAASALEYIRRDPPDVLVCDIAMPGADGYDLLRQVRALAPECGGLIPAAALTAYAGAEDRRRSSEAGFGIHLAKPVESRELVAALVELTRGAVAR